MEEGYEIRTPYDDDFLDGMNGLDSICGTNTRWLNKRIYQLEKLPKLNSKLRKELQNAYSQLGRMPGGNKKPKTCWDFVNKGICIHGNVNTKNGGISVGNRWHPDPEECDYLKKRNRWKNGGSVYGKMQCIPRPSRRQIVLMESLDTPIPKNQRRKSTNNRYVCGNDHEDFAWSEEQVSTFYEKWNPSYLKKHSASRLVEHWNKFKPHLIVEECRRKYGSTPDI